MKVVAAVLEFGGHIPEECRQGTVGNIYRRSLDMR
jgi:hypothetical protein